MKTPDISPSKLAIRFLKWICPPELLEGIEGDLLEDFESEAREFGYKKARHRLIFKTISFFQPGIIFRNKLTLNLQNLSMLNSHIKISWRNLLRNKSYSAINILGLAIGIAACLITFSYIRFELSFDDFHPDADRTYRVNETMIWRPEGGIFDSTGPALADALSQGFPEIGEVLRINTAGSYIIRRDDGEGNISAFNEDNVLAADSDFFDFFGFRLREGDPKSALTGVNKVVISDKAEKKIFGDQPALGRFLLLGDDRTPLIVTGVTEPQPANAHFHFDYLLSMATNPNIKRFEWSWIWTQVVTYVKLRNGASPDDIKAKLAKLGTERVKPSCERYGIDYDQIIKGKGGWNFYLQPVRDIHLHAAGAGNRLGPVGDITYPVAFGMIGIFILIIASINFINLSTARATKRAREVGVKKAMGALRNALIWQFQVESILIAMLATLLALLLTRVMISLLSQAAGIGIPGGIFEDIRYLLFLPVIPIIIGFLAGLYPSFYLTSFRPARVLKGNFSSGTGNPALRNILVTVQFIISIALIAGTLIIYRQVNFLRNKDLGFDKENIFVISHAEKLGDHIKAFRDEIAGLPGVSDVSVSMDVPGGGYYEDIWTMDGSTTKIPVTELKADSHFFDLLGLKLAAGKEFNGDDPTDRYVAVPNETAVRLFGYTPQEALGKYIVYPADNYVKLEIIGVVKDFNYHSLHETVSPIVLIPTDAKIWGDMRVISVKYSGQGFQKIINTIDSKWKGILNDTPFGWSFLDQTLAHQYDEEQKLGSMIGMLSFLSVIVALIGLVGLVSYSVEVRKKEIGIRKVFGASLSHIMIMFNNQYAKLIAIALVIASPISWILISKWLNSFAYKIEIHGYVFLLAGVIELIIAGLCVGYISLRAALMNPAETLNYE